MWCAHLYVCVCVCVQSASISRHKQRNRKPIMYINFGQKNTHCETFIYILVIWKVAFQPTERNEKKTMARKKPFHTFYGGWISNQKRRASNFPKYARFVVIFNVIESSNFHWIHKYHEHTFFPLEQLMEWTPFNIPKSKI